MKLFFVILFWFTIVATRLAYSIRHHRAWWVNWCEGFAAGWLGSVCVLRQEPPYRVGRTFGSVSADVVRIAIFLGLGTAVWVSFAWATQ